MIAKILLAWEEKPWLPKTATLFSHLPHIAGSTAAGAYIFLWIMAIGGQDWRFAFLIGDVAAFTIFASVELKTADSKGNWYDSMFDLEQYAVVLTLIPLVYGLIVWHIAGLLAWIAGYITFLLNKPE